jgi:hypothetical protein
LDVTKEPDVSLCPEIWHDFVLIEVQESVTVESLATVIVPRFPFAFNSTLGAFVVALVDGCAFSANPKMGAPKRTAIPMKTTAFWFIPTSYTGFIAVHKHAKNNTVIPDMEPVIKRLV